MDYLGIEYLIPQTMTGVDIDTDFDEFQVRYLAFTKFLPPANFEFQHKISEILNKYFEDSNRTKL